jgi:prophage regulatory protein
MKRNARGQPVSGALKLLSYCDLKERKGVKFSKAQLFRNMRDGKFPRQVKAGDNTNAWIESEVDEWIEALIRDRDARQAAATEAEGSAKAASTMPLSTDKSKPASTPKITRKRTATPKEARAGN